MSQRSGYQAIDQKGWTMTQILGGVAVLSVSIGVVVGLVASPAAAPSTSLYAPATSTSVRPMTRVAPQPASIPMSRAAQYAAVQQLQAQGEETYAAEPVFAAQAPQTQNTWVFGLLLAPVAAVAAWFAAKATEKKPAYNSLDVEEGNWAMAASAAELRDRLTSVKNSKKITDAMKLVASAKLRKAQQAVVEARPFSDALQGVFGDVVGRLEGSDAAELPLLKKREVKNITMVIIGGDRGLCGAYNNQLIKRAALRFDELKAAGYNVKCITIGKKVTSWFGRRAELYPMIKSYECSTCVPQVPEIVEELVGEYASGEVDTVELLYTNFVSLVKTNPGTRSLLPFKPTEATSEVDEICRLTTKDGKLAVECEPGEEPENLIEADVTFEQSPEEILDSLIPLYLNSQLVRTLQESVASELSARMTSMQNASDNAKELGKNLNLQYNRIRQAAVTSSILEIAAGASANA
eukprot:CAMPEP_0174280908 /NCGR_PEP_ID=MMETSP0809-20121228/1219_1 /TAXON_ID=73025 ORGANISM="Eutreptiella gymnastica-like, Strain CCMP1594" /NCGR_SAMPLE_ID=MMETSP0809 /ASSEMBLY_ACC=CAM_ASM_000658 /LENGTH=464 /DNA_ID=CAMNT_0015374101 /DNA_START=44 /DNA_END=1438 /DNA_ORIENTATION=-